MNKKLQRDENNKMIGGVVAGFADYVRHDVTLWRLGVVALAIITGVIPVLVFYLISWIVMPPKGSTPDEVHYEVVD